MKPKHYLLLGVALLFIAAGYALRPVPTPNEKDCLVFTGVVEEINEGGYKDVLFKLKGVKREYYINRGLDYGLTLDDLRKNLIGKEVTIKYPDYTPLLASESIRHLSKLEYNGITIYSEIK